MITHIVYAGPGAEQGVDGLQPDADFQERELEGIFAATAGVNYYLGEWHSHPGRGAIASPTDRCTLRRIAVDPETLTPRPHPLLRKLDKLAMSGDLSEPERAEWWARMIGAV